MLTLGYLVSNKSKRGVHTVTLMFKELFQTKGVFWVNIESTVDNYVIDTFVTFSDRIISEMSRYTCSMWPKYIQPKSLF